jgi:predicted site-specific integrase-resolvase
MKDKEVLLNRKEVANFFGVSQSTIENWKNNGFLPYVRLSGGNSGKNKTIRYCLSKMQEIIRRNTIPSKKDLVERAGF